MFKNTALTKHLAAVATASALCLPMASQAQTQTQTVTTVNGKPVLQARVDVLINQAIEQGGQQRTPQLEQLVRDEVVRREIYMQEAARSGVARDPAFLTQLAQMREQLMMRWLFDGYLKKHPVNEAEIQAGYDQAKRSRAPTEYHARHILLDKQDDALAVIAQLKAGARFEDLAKTKSKDAGSAPNGGDLDWARPDSFVPEFTQALKKLSNGQVTDTPVHTQFGYHVIKLEEVREPEFPPLEQIRGQVVQMVQQQKLVAYQAELRAAAKTDYKFSSK